MSEEQDRLRLQLDRDLDRFEAAGMPDEAAAVRQRLAELGKDAPEPEPEPKAATRAATKKEG
jgi:hypothetical protein